MFIDCHYHMSDPNAKKDRNEIKERFSRAALKLEDCEVNEVNAIYWPSIVNESCRGLGDELKDAYKGRIKLNTGMHFFLESKNELWRNIDLEKESSLDFIKVYDLLFRKFDLVSIEFLDYYVKKGFNKFQTHSFKLSNSELNKLEPYMKCGVKFYLAHGASAFNESLKNRDINVERLRDFKGKLFLGTTHYRSLTLDVSYLKSALNNGLDDMLCFESDFNILMFDKLDYNEYMDAVKKAIPIDKIEKIFYNNAKQF